MLEDTTRIFTHIALGPAKQQRIFTNFKQECGFIFFTSEPELDFLSCSVRL